jgi:hypothetical protein
LSLPRGILLLTLLFTVHLVARAAFATDHYFSPTGDDANPGTSSQHPWKTLTPVATLPLAPGDRLLLQRGATFHGSLALRASGTSASPILLGSYGNGDLPVIDACGAPIALTLENSSHWIVQDIAIINAPPSTPPDKKPRSGILVRASSGNLIRDITLRRLLIHDIAGNDERGGGCGILIQAVNAPQKSHPATSPASPPALSTAKPATFDAITIEQCLLHDVPFNGIFVENWPGRKRDPAGHLITPVTHLLIRDNLLYNVAGDAICIIGADHALIEHNEVYRSSFGQTRGAKTPSAGIWPHSSDFTTMRYNRVEGLRGLLDALAFDVDIECHDTLVEHNLSRNNGNGFLLICGTDGASLPHLSRTSRTLVRNNMSLDDAVEPRGSVLEIVSYVSDITFDNNLFLRTQKGKRNLLLCGGWLHKTWPQNITFTHNIFATTGTFQTVVGNATGLAFHDNLWSGTFSPTFPDTTAHSADPQFLAWPQSEQWQVSLANRSPAIDVGFKPFSCAGVGLTPGNPWLSIRDQTLTLNPLPQ